MHEARGQAVHLLDLIDLPLLGALLDVERALSRLDRPPLLGTLLHWHPDRRGPPDRLSLSSYSLCALTQPEQRLLGAKRCAPNDLGKQIPNPLGGIGGFAGLLERDLAVDDPRRRLVKKIVEGVESLNRMVTNLLNYTRPLQLNLRPVDFVEVVEDCMGFFEIDAGTRLENIELQRDYPREGLHCRTDPEQIQQIVLNLLHNAVQAMPSGGRIKVGVGEADGGDNALTGLTGPCVTLSVADSGVGMSDEVREKLFMPFFTTKEDGNGLGLATAKKVIEAHGGEILVDSAPQEGSSFTILIPR